MLIYKYFSMIAKISDKAVLTKNKTTVKKTKKKSKKTNLQLYEEYLEAKKERSRKFKNKPLWREVCEVIAACVIIYLAYLLFF